MAYSYRYPRPAVTADCVVFGLDEAELSVLLVERAEAPFKGAWALPGGFVRQEEALEAAARRELAEEAGLTDLFLEQLYTFGDPGRDPRGRVITVAYYALVRLAEHPARAGSDAAAVRWFPARRPPPLAFDHATILATALERLRGKVRYKPLGFELLPPKFTLSQLQTVYEAVLGVTLDKRNFRKKLLAYDLVRPLDQQLQPKVGRPARLYAFDRARYRRLERDGMLFEI